MNIDDIRKAEFEALREAKPDLKAEALIGLAFSGGGIRSATFNLGILQGLAQRGLLKHVDYLSTVSGGGYIGGWYMAFLRHQAGGDVKYAEELLNPEDARYRGNRAEHPSITWLRRFSNYLAPKTGLSGDTLTIASTYLRNLLLNLVIIVAFLGAVLLLPRVAAWGIAPAHASDCLPLLATLPLLFAVAAAMVLLVRLPEPQGREAESHDRKAGTSWADRQGGVLALVVLPVVVAACFTAVGIASSGYERWAGGLAGSLVGEPSLLGWRPPADLVGTLLVAFAYTLPWFIGGIVQAARGQRPEAPLVAVMALSALAASVLAGIVFFGLSRLASALAPEECELAGFALAAFGPPLVILAYMLPVTLHIGLARRRFTDIAREWWARLGGWLLAVALGWALLCAIALFTPEIFAWLNRFSKWLVASGGLAWLASTLWGVLVGKGAATGEAGAGGLKEMLLKVVPWVFVLGLLIFLSAGLHQALESDGSVAIGSVVKAGLVLLILFGLFGWRVDINLFSLHNFYRNRLARCYLGASRHCEPEAAAERHCRRPNPFTGFDPDDDMAVSELGPRPYPLFNTALNLVGGEELAWQQRKAASFCIAPRWSGYEFPQGMAQGATAYGPTKTFLEGNFKGGGGARLSTAMTISGAAVNPNMGFHSSPAVSFLLTVFNVRLGRWVGNPTDSEAWRMDSPTFGVRYLFYELFGLTSTRCPWFNLSDGGHFENLGLYELVRRRLPYIVACDAAEDAGYNFDDLANAIRKIRADFGIDIEIDVSGLRPQQAGGRPRAHAAVGVIRYDCVDRSLRPGVLVYLRPGLTGDEPADVAGYARRNPAFPFQSTVDQFFDEAQFESYRALGLHIAKGVFEEAAERFPPTEAGFNPEGFFTVMKESWRGRLQVDGAAAAGHQKCLDDLFERLRKEPELAFLSAEVFPEWPHLTGQPPAAAALPAGEAQRRAGFYVCREAAQLMERVYQDLDLERQHDHPDSRGWMNLFRHWSWSPMFRVTYAITASTLSEPFQRFCKRRLELDLGEMAPTAEGLDAASLGRLNSVERSLADAVMTAPREAGVPAPDKLVRFEMVVRYPAARPGGTPAELLRFPVGFALLEGDRLAYLRIQDHLRRMGLARAALGLLAAQKPSLEVATPTLEERPEAAPGARKQRETLVRLFQSVKFGRL